MLLAAFLVQAYPSSAALHEIILDFHLQDRANAGKAVGHEADQRRIAQAQEIGTFNCDAVLIGRFGDRAAYEPRRRLGPASCLSSGRISGRAWHGPD
jgi:hypothetical protein